MSESEQKAMEDQLMQLRRSHEEAELKAQKRIVELMEKSSDLQRSLDKSESDGRALRFNNTEMMFRISELETKHRNSELRAQEEAERTRSLREEVRRLQEDADHHRTRADTAGRER